MQISGMNAPVRHPSNFSSGEFRRLVSAGGFGDTRVELRRGMILKASPQHISRARIKRLLSRAIETTLSAARRKWTVDQEVSVAFFEGFEPLPDIVVWDDAGAPIEGPVPAATVKLIAEISDSSLADDLGEKLLDYARGGLAEYWAADIKGRVILRHAAPSEAGYARREATRFGEPTAWLAASDLVVDTQTL